MTNPTTKVKGLRVVCDGSNLRTKVYDSKGNCIGPIQRLQITIDCSTPHPTLMLQLPISEIDIVIPEEGVDVKLDPIVSLEEV